MNWRYKQEGLFVFWPESVCFVLTGEPDKREEGRGERAERKWLTLGREKRISFLILSPIGKGGWEVTVKEPVWHRRRSTSLGGNHQFSLLPATIGQDEVPRQGKILISMMFLVVPYFHVKCCTLTGLYVCVHYRCFLKFRSTKSLSWREKQNRRMSHLETFSFFFFFAYVWVSVYFGFCISCTLGIFPPYPLLAHQW